MIGSDASTINPGGPNRGVQAPRPGRIAPPRVTRPAPVDVGGYGHPARLPQDLSPGTGGGVPPGGDAPTPSPLDATFYQNVLANQFKVGNQLNALQQRGQYANTALQAALAKLAYQQPRDSLKLEQGANRSGSLYSSAYGQNQGNLQYGYAGRQGGLQENYAQQNAARQAQMGALRGGEQIYNQGQYLEAVLRASQAAQKNPATGESAAPLKAALNNRGRGRASRQDIG